MAGHFLLRTAKIKPPSMNAMAWTQNRRLLPSTFNSRKACLNPRKRKTWSWESRGKGIALRHHWWFRVNGLCA